MAEKSTFIKLDRNIINWRWYKNANTFRVFIHLLLSANVISHEFEKITVNRGELVSSYGRISDALGISNQQTRTAIEHLKDTGELTVKKYPKYQVFTIVNYDRYQSNQQANNRQITGNQQSSNSQLTGNQQQYKNDKNDKNVKNVNNERVESKRTPHPDKKTYGQFSNVFLSDEEYGVLIDLYPRDYQKKIDRLSEYMYQKKKNYADHYSVIVKWAKEDEKKQKKEDNNCNFEINNFMALNLYKSNSKLYHELYPDLTKDEIINKLAEKNS